MPGGMNMQAMMKQAQQMQQRLKEEVAAIRVTGKAGGGAVTVDMDGNRHVLDVKIDPDAAGDAEMLQDLVKAACNDAVQQVETKSEAIMGGMLGGLGLPPGMF